MDENAPRGTKRKRYEPPQHDPATKIRGKLRHGVKEIKKVAKKAKTFETQKLIKKLKDFRKKGEKPEEIAEVESLLKTLKTLDHDLVATTALKTKLNKVRILHENEHIQAAISKELTDGLVHAPSGSQSAKLQSRLLSSKILATEITLVVDALKALLQPTSGAVTEEGGGDEVNITRPQKSQKFTGPRSKDEDALEMNQPKTVEVAEMKQPDGTAAIDNDHEPAAAEEWESGSITDEEGQDSVEDEESDIDETAAHHVSSKLGKMETKTSSVHSTFLPSLSVGFIRGSDESDFSETEANIADPDIKKNRRGQRARRAIWEKKYGKNANHKKKELENKGKPFERPKEGRSNTQTSRPPPRPFEGMESAAPQRHHRGAKMGHAATGDDKPLHPSWEAKRKLKEKEKASIVPSQGKKITFS